MLDFGVAKLADMASASTTKTGTIVGTPLFMSPEQIRGASHVDHRADLYSLGMVFYNMVTGIHAFNGPSYSDVLVAICTEPLPDIREKAPWLPEIVGSWFAKACARDVADRFQSADEMIEALARRRGRAQPSRPRVGTRRRERAVGHAHGSRFRPTLATVQAGAVNVELRRPASDNTLRSRTGPQRRPDAYANPEPPPSSRSRPKSFDARLRDARPVGRELCVLLVGASLALRWAYGLVFESDERPIPSASVATREPVRPPATEPSAPVKPAVDSAPSVPTPPPAPSAPEASATSSAPARRWVA